MIMMIMMKMMTMMMMMMVLMMLAVILQLFDCELANREGALNKGGVGGLLSSTVCHDDDNVQ